MVIRFVIGDEHCADPLDCSSLNGLLRETDAQSVAVAPGELNVADTVLDAVSSRLTPHHAAVLLFPANNPLLKLACDELPAACLPFAFSPLGTSIVVIATEAMSQVGDVTDSIRDWLIRAVLSGKKLIALSIEIPGAAVSLADQLPDLGPGNPHPGSDLGSRLGDLSPDSILGSIASQPDAIAMIAGFLLMNDYLDQSHTLSQSVEGGGRHAAGDYWHAIMHRREPDYSNSKYWFRRVGDHPLFDDLGSFAGDALARCASASAGDWRSRLSIPDRWDPFAFVDMCQSCVSATDVAMNRVAKEIQFAEMLLLLGANCRDAIGCE